MFEALHGVENKSNIYINSKLAGVVALNEKSRFGLDVSNSIL